MEKEQKKYKIGLDIGTNSVGWACVDENNDILQKDGKYLWGSRLFDEAQPRRGRRINRGARRRIARRKQRINELNRILKPKMDEIDSEFFNKMQESFFIKDDVENTRDWSCQFFKDKKEVKKLMYITDSEGLPIRKNIYHLRSECMQDKKVDFRLVYLSLHHIMKYRGNFLYEDSQVEGVINGDSSSGSKEMIKEKLGELNDQISKMLGVELNLNLSQVGEENAENEANFEKIADILLEKGKRKKDIEAELQIFVKNKLGFAAKTRQSQIFNEIIKLIIGYTADLKNIFELTGNGKLQLGKLSEKEDELRQKLGENFEIIETLNSLYSVFMFNNILNGKSSISEAKIESYEKHRSHLKMLKELYKLGDKNIFSKEEYQKMFGKPMKAEGITNSKENEDTEAQLLDGSTEQNKKSNTQKGQKPKKLEYDEKFANYYNYINSSKEVEQEEFGNFVRRELEKLEKKLETKISKAEDCSGLSEEEIKNKVKEFEKTEAEFKNIKDRFKELKDDIFTLINNHEFMPKQTVVDNGAIPMQFHRAELEKIIDSQGIYYSILKENKEVLLKLFSFRIPYWYGPLNSNSSFSWIEKRGLKNLSADDRKKQKDNIKIDYTNFDDENVIDTEKTQENFITRMLNHCEYLYNEKCMPKCSITCEVYECLSELNGIKVDGRYLSTDTRKNFIKGVLIKDSEVKYTPTGLKTFLSSKEGCGANLKIEGLSDLNKFNSSFKTTQFFVGLGFPLTTIKENLNRFDELCKDMTIFKEGDCRKKRLEKFKDLLQTDVNFKAVLNHKFDGWSRLSKELVLGLKDKYGRTILGYMWDNPNGDKTVPKLMNLIASDKYGFKAVIENRQGKYKEDNKQTLEEVVSESYCSPPVKRATIQAIKIVDEIVKIMDDCKPSRICVEFSSDGDKTPKDSREKQLTKLYNKIKDEINKEDSDIAQYIKSNGNLNKQDILNDVQSMEKRLKEKKNELSDEKVFLYFIQMGKSLYSMEPLSLDNLADTEVDHILPRSLIVDNSLDNKALVLKTENQNKKGRCFVGYHKEFFGQGKRAQVDGWWEYLMKNNLLSPKKYKNLHLDWDKEDIYTGFINRQLVETRQAIKLVIELLKEKYPDVPDENNKWLVNHQVVALNATLSSAYRQRNELYKLRIVNDYHHAHDAYLSAVLGDYIYNKFPYLSRKIYNEEAKEAQKKFYEAFKNAQKYDINNKECDYGAIIRMLDYDVINKNTGEVCWKKEWNKTIKERIYNEKVKCFISRMVNIKQNGQFYKLTILKKEKPEASIPTKKNRSDVKKYGGLTGKVTALNFIIKETIETKKKQKVKYILEAVGFMDLAKAKSKNVSIEEYILTKIVPKPDAKYEVVAKIYDNQLVEIDGHPVYMNGGDVTNARQIKLSEEICRTLYALIGDVGSGVEKSNSKKSNDEDTNSEEPRTDDANNKKARNEKHKPHYELLVKYGDRIGNTREEKLAYAKQKGEEMASNLANKCIEKFVEKLEKSCSEMVGIGKQIEKLKKFSDEKFKSLTIEDKCEVLEKMFFLVRKGRVQESSFKFKSELGGSFGRATISSVNGHSFAIINRSITGFYQQRKEIIKKKDK